MFLGFWVLGVIIISLILLIIIGITKSKLLAALLKSLWIIIVFFYILSFVLEPFYKKTVLHKSDYYGSYVIDTNYFDKVQANWQYNHFRFKISKNDSIFLYITDSERIIKTYKGTISTVKPHNSERLVISMNLPNEYIQMTNPTTYRSIWDFTLVFNSPKYSNMYFKKGSWKATN